jgi:hypothetical protein
MEGLLELNCGITKNVEKKIDSRRRIRYYYYIEKNIRTILVCN